jgi:phage protein U
MYAQIGDIVLSNQYGFTGFTDERGNSIIEHALISSKPRLQLTGENLIKLTFSITLHVTFCDPEKEYERFNNYVKNSTPVPITLGTGEFLGNFVLPSISKDVTNTFKDGRIIECIISLSALEFVGEIRQNKGTAIASNNPQEFDSIVVGKGPSGTIASEVSEINSLAIKIDDDLRIAETQPLTRSQKIKESLLNVQQADKKFVNIYTATSNVFRLAQEAKNVAQKAKRAQKDLKKLESFLKIKDLNSAQGASKDFKTNMNNVGGATAPFTKNYILRRSV